MRIMWREFFYLFAQFYITVGQFHENDFQINPDQIGRQLPELLSMERNGVHFGSYNNAIQLNGMYSSNAIHTNITEGVSIEIQLKDYMNEDSRLPEEKTCICPAGFSCNYLGTLVAKCHMSFTILVSSADDPVQYASTGFLPLNPTGSIDVQLLAEKERHQWNQQYVFKLKSKPSAIDVFVHHMGVVIDTKTGDLSRMQTVVHVDTFHQPLNDVIPSVGTLQAIGQTEMLVGRKLNTRLSLSFSVQCIGSLAGPDCDMKCNTSALNPLIYICRSKKTGFFYSCSHAMGSQVRDCVSCPWGTVDNSYCRDSEGQSLDVELVPSIFRMLTIILGIIGAVFFIALIAMLLMSCTQYRKARQNGNAPGHNYRATHTVGGNTDQPLLQSARPLTANMNSKSSESQRVPLLPPRFIPPISNGNLKSSIRKPLYVPPAHLGGGSTINDTLNSTISSVQLPSREADV